MRRYLPTLLAVLLLTGCATLFSASNVPVSFNSNPPGAEVLIEGNSVGTTPFTVNLNNHMGHRVILRREGHQDFTCMFDTGVPAKWVILDILGGFVPIIIDAATGDWKELQTDVCNATLAPEDL